MVHECRRFSSLGCAGLLLVLTGACVRPEVEHKARGNVLFRNGDLSGAIREYRAALALAPDDPVAQTLLGNALFEQGRYDAAAVAYQAALARDAGAREAQRGLAVTALRRGRDQEAVAGFTALIKQWPADYEAHAALGKLLLGRGDLEGAARHLGESLRWVGNDSATLYAFAVTRLRQGRVQEAQTLLLRLEEVAPGAPYSAYGRALIAARAGKSDEALLWIGRALERGMDRFDEIARDTDLGSVRGDSRLVGLLESARQRKPAR